MEYWLMSAAEEPSENSYEEKEGREYFMIFKAMERLDDLFTRAMRKKKKDQEEEIQEYYNVSVYRMLPYPPNTKDVKDFFVQRN